MTKNDFYSDYDTETLEDKRPKDYRTPFQIDRDRIIHSAAFRKLQSKTQVYLSGEYDFYRTRLTHSIEVAQIGRSICHALKAKTDLLSDAYFIDSELVEACCLSHDLGHPPFGHAGERTLHRLFQEFGGFEGNAQTLRLTADTLYQSGSCLNGMAPTRAFLDGVMKYKTLFEESDNPENHFLYDFQLPYRDFAHMASSELMGSQEPSAFDGLSSIECQIMDWSDDTAYCLNDIVDGVRAGFISIDRLERWAGTKGLDASAQPLFDSLADLIRRDRLDAAFGKKIGEFIDACSLAEVENPLSFSSNRYRYKLVVDSNARRQAGFLKEVAVDLIFRSSPLQQMEYKVDRILAAIFDALKESYLASNSVASAAILPDGTADLICKAKDRQAKSIVLRDFLANLSDREALRIYKRLFDPEYGSIMDLE